jgi:uncharacterized protein (TIGR02246 family)
MRYCRILAILTVTLFAFVFESGSMYRLLASSATKSPVAKSAQVSPGTPDEIAKIREQWMREFNAKHLDGVVSLYASDGVFITGEGACIAGRTAVYDLYKSTFEVNNPDISLLSVKIEVSGDLAYDSGTYEETIGSVKNPSGPRPGNHGTYLMIFKRQPDGNWRIVEHMWAGRPVESK